MREIALDTETTGFDASGADRIVEIGCVEMINHVATGKTYHQYINPERDMPEGAFQVHGLSEDFLRQYPVFADVAAAFLDFVGDDPLVIHNAKFDMGFLNAELKRLGTNPLANKAIDTVGIARSKFPGSPASLDALCRRFNIDNSNRTLHGALLDAELLAEVYLELKGGAQPDFALDPRAAKQASNASGPVTRERREPRPHAPTPDEAAAHAAFLAQISDPVWTR
ncbi:MAG: DNA polymerase III subunit epsilon [Magnetovibrionaceae bacterium]